MSWIRRIVSVLLLLCMLITTAYAAVPIGIEPQYTHIFIISAALSSSGSTLNCSALGRAKTSNTTTKLKASLQERSSANDDWHTVISWTDTAQGLFTATIGETYTATSGCQYRLYVTCDINDADGNNLEHGWKYSHTVP